MRSLVTLARCLPEPTEKTARRSAPPLCRLRQILADFCNKNIMTGVLLWAHSRIDAMLSPAVTSWDFGFSESEDCQRGTLFPMVWMVADAVERNRSPNRRNREFFEKFRPKQA